jgi:hypothetical protein
MEKEIIELLKSKNLNKMGMGHLVELYSEYDEDGDELPVTLNAVEITDKGLIAYNTNDEYMTWNVAELPDEKQKEILWSLSVHPWDVWNWCEYGVNV